MHHFCLYLSLSRFQFHVIALLDNMHLFKITTHGASKIIR